MIDIEKAKFEVRDNDSVVLLNKKVLSWLKTIEEWSASVDITNKAADDLIANLQAENAQLVAFIAAFKVLLGDKTKQAYQLYLDDRTEYNCGWWQGVQEMREMYEVYQDKHIKDGDNE